MNLTKETQPKHWVATWYREKEWAEWCRVCEFKGSYSEWLARAEAGAKEFEKKGFNVVKVEIEPSGFIEWCRTNSRNTDHAARATYAMVMLNSRAHPRSALRS